MQQKKLENIFGKVFISDDKSEYGTIRKVDNKTFILDNWTTFAMDDCGNFFVENSKGKIAFFDHETNEIIILADSFTDFCKTQ